MMKKIYVFYVISLISLLSLSIKAQQIGDLKGIYYQAVAIDENGKEIVGMDVNGKPLFNKAIGVRFTITKGLNGPVEWEETHTTTTDKYGLFSLTIGMGHPTGNALYTRLLDIPWIDADQFLKVEIATKNDGNYKLVSNQQFMSVPYSFYTDDIADNAVTTNKVLDSTLINRDVHTGAIDTRTLLDFGILNEDIKTASVDSRTLLDSTIINRDIHIGAIDSRSILNATIKNEDIADTTIDLTKKVSKILPVANGGTGVDTVPSGGLLIGAGAGPLKSLGYATDGQIPIGVTGSDPVLGNINPGIGISVTNTPGGITISSTVSGGVNSNSNTNINPGNIPAGKSWLSPTFVLQQPANLPPVAMGDILIASANIDMQGCIMNVYLENVNSGTAHARVVIFNPGATAVNLGNGVAVKILVVK